MQDSAQSRELNRPAGHYFYRYRTYFPDWGHFTGPDPDIRLDGNGPGGYAAMNNNPQTWVDPDGLKWRPTKWLLKKFFSNQAQRALRAGRDYYKGLSDQLDYNEVVVPAMTPGYIIVWYVTKILGVSTPPFPFPPPVGPDDSRMMKAGAMTANVISTIGNAVKMAGAIQAFLASGVGGSLTLASIGGGPVSTVPAAVTTALVVEGAILTSWALASEVAVIHSIMHMKPGRGGGSSASREKGKTFRGGNKSSRDYWGKYSNDKDFQRWWHRKGKKEWGNQDIEPEMLDEVYDYWIEQGKPTVK